MITGPIKTLAIASITAGWLLAGPLPASAAARSAAADPAGNFYAWANREWLEAAAIPADKARVDNFTFLEDTTTAQLGTLILDLKAAKARTPEQDKLVRLYDSFVDLGRRDARGLAPIVGDLARIDRAKTHRDVALLLADFQALGVSAPIRVWPVSDFMDSTTNLGEVSQGGLGLERDYYLGTDERAREQRKLYRNYLARLFELAAIPDGAAAADRVIGLEGKLAAIQWSRVDNRDLQKTYNPTTAEAFAKTSAGFHGDDLLQALGVPRDARLSVAQPDYVAKLGPLFQGSPVAVWQDYLRAHLLTTYAGLLTSGFKSARAQYQKDLGLIQEEEELWKQGVGFVAGVANMMLGRAYVEKYYDPATTAAVTDIVLSIRDSYRAAIEGSSWMSRDTRKKALEKLDKLQFKIGYPDQWRDYTALEIPGTDLADNYRRAMLFEHQRNMAKIGRRVDRNDWDNSPHEINAFYDPTRNEFVLLAAILQEPFYGAKATAAMQYGSLGFVVGHEIGHGFDDQGSRFDGDGNLVNWWTESDARAYGDKQQRLIEQANAYEILPGTFLKGEQEIGEIMGDLSGAQIALQAYRKTPGATDEAFFRQLAQTWRSKWRDEFLKMIVQEDPHPPSEFRANGIVKQFGQFHEAYGVKPGDPMYLAPEKRVLMW